VFADLSLDMKAVINRGLYTLCLHWSRIMLVFEPANKQEGIFSTAPAELEEWKRESMLLLASYLSLGAGYSSRLCQMMEELLQLLTSTKRSVYYDDLTGRLKDDVHIIVLFDFLAERDDRNMIGRMVDLVL
jgi:hypothetical protein